MVTEQAGPETLLGETPDGGHAWRWWVLSCTSIGALLASINSGTLIIALPALLRSLNASVLAVVWTLIGYILAQGVCVLSVGRLGDMWGRRRLFLAGFISFTVLALLCGFAPNAGVLVALRVAQGAFSSMMIATSSAIVTDAFPRRELGLALGINAMVVAVGSALGPVLGGWLVGFGWQWVFWFNVPFGAAATVWSFMVLREPRRARRAQRIDWWGNLVLMATLTGMLLALSMGGLEGWTHPVVIAGAIAFVIGLPLFLWIEGRVTDPLLDLGLFRNRLFAVANFTQLINGTGRMGLLFILVFFFQGPQGRDAVEAGVLTLPLAVSMMLVSPLSGWVSDHFGSRLLSSGGILITGAGLLYMGVDFSVDMPYWHLALGMSMVGLGVGMFNSPNAGAIMAAVAPEQRGVAAGVRMLGAFIGVMLAIAFVLAIVTTALPHSVTLRIFSGQSAGVPSGDVAAFITGARIAVLVLAMLSILSAPLSLLRGQEERRGHRGGAEIAAA